MLRSDAKRFFWLTRSMMLVRRLPLRDVFISSSAEKNASDGCSDVNDMVRWTSRLISSSDRIFELIDWFECDISPGIWNMIQYRFFGFLFYNFFFFPRHFHYSPKFRYAGNSRRWVLIRMHLIWVLALASISVLEFLFRNRNAWLWPVIWRHQLNASMPSD